MTLFVQSEATPFGLGKHLSDCAKAGPDVILLRLYSGYEAYDRLSPAFKRFLEGLTAVHNADFFIKGSTSHTCTLREFILTLNSIADGS